MIINVLLKYPVPFYLVLLFLERFLTINIACVQGVHVCTSRIISRWHFLH